MWREKGGQPEFIPSFTEWVVSRHTDFPAVMLHSQPSKICNPQEQHHFNPDGPGIGRWFSQVSSKSQYVQASTTVEC